MGVKATKNVQYVINKKYTPTPIPATLTHSPYYVSITYGLSLFSVLVYKTFSPGGALG